MDASLAGSPSTAALTYPFEPPETGRTLEVAEGVLWLRMPLPFTLDHINLYLLDDGPGWTLVDTGLATQASEKVWERVIAEDLGGRAITRIICTHMHPDHVGLAGWLAERFDAPLWMSRLEYVTARMLIADVPPAPPAAIAFYRAAGWDEAALDAYRERFGMFGSGVRPMPQAFIRVADGDEIAIGEGRWRAVIGCGHSPEHLCLWNEERALFVSGDQV
ncbi:MAG: MBL fold metallo-hydrolase, partial [Caulobacterales bacterium]|nr:MBL fold metallo-hydrolase [Caulobacterales bacterium]